MSSVAAARHHEHKNFPFSSRFLPTNSGAMQMETGRMLLRQMLGPAADFREGQWEAIELAAHQRQRVLVVQRTGWGKSIVYFLATKILRDSGAGPTLLISPLLSLMRNQILSAERLGIRASTIHSENLSEWDEVEGKLAANEVDLLMVSPERLGNESFLNKLLPVIQGNIGMFVVDEAHCISDWGHDFRPDYRRIVRILRLLPAKVPVLCTTATANDRVVKDIQTQITNIRILRGPLIRNSLKLFNITLDDQAERLAWLGHYLPQLPGSGIVYTLTVQDARRVAEWLQLQRIPARPYHADLQAEERISAEQQLLKNEVKALVATVALGMGFDKPDLGFVVHFQRPGSVVAYYQQVGRAGRAVDSAFGILLSGREDDEIQDYFIRTAFPPTEVMEEVLKELAGREGMTVEEIGAILNYSRSTLEKGLKLLEVDGAVQRQQTKFSRTANRWNPDLLRADQVTVHRRAELAEIQKYVEHTGCLMEFLARALDDPTAARCGKCMNCTGKIERRPTPPQLVQAASEFLRNDTLILEPRHHWPKPVLEELEKTWPPIVGRFETGKAKVTIPAHLCAEPGRVLCYYGDAGWGREVARGKYEGGRFSNALVKAATDLIQQKWKPEPPLQWVTAVPSQRHPTLVWDFAQRLADDLALPFKPVLRKWHETRPQKEMQNSAMQLHNLLKCFEVVRPQSAPVTGERRANGFTSIVRRFSQGLATAIAQPPVLDPGPVLLVDDISDSRWTLTLAAVLLRLHGSGPVFPFALARASLRGS